MVKIASAVAALSTSAFAGKRHAKPFATTLKRYAHVACACLLLGIGAALSGPAFGQAQPVHRLTIDDLLKLEALGAGAIDPSGTSLVYERLRPYDESDDYSFRTYAFGKTGHQLWLYNLRKGKRPVPLPGLDRAPHSYIQGFSPSGRFMAIMQYRNGRLSLGSYSFADRRFVRFEATPAFSRDGQYNPIWRSDDELIFAALPAGQQPDVTSVRAKTGEVLAKAWADAWGGRTATASEVRIQSKDESGQQEFGNLMVANTRTGKTRVLAPGLFADLRLSPDRQRLAAMTVSRPRPVDPTKLAENDPRRFQLILFDLDTGTRRLLAPELEFFPYTIAWSADGQKLAAYGWQPGQSPHDGRFYVVDIANGSVTRYDHRGLDLVSERERGWLQRPERVAFLGHDLAVFARLIPANEDQAPRFTYRSYGDKGLSRADWFALSTNGRSINLSKGLPGVSGVPLHASDRELAIAAEDGVYRLTVAGEQRRLTPAVPGHFRYISPGTFATRESVIRPDFADEALFSVNGGGSTKIVLVDLRAGREGHVELVETPTNNAAPLAGTLATGSVLFQSENGSMSSLLLAKAGDDKPQELARLNQHLTGIDLGRWERVSYKVFSGADAGQTVESCVLFPPGASQASPPPLVVEVYPDAKPKCGSGGPVIDPYSINWSPYLWASKGYAYARLTTPRALIRNADGPIAGMPAVVDAGIAALVDKGLVDPKRLALVGYSQGGISALYVAAHATRFRGVIAMNGWADLFSDYFGPNGVYSSVYREAFGDFGRYDDEAGSDFGIGRTPFEDPQTYFRNSPVFLAPKITAPVMLIHSDMDSFSMYQFDEMYGALTRAGKDARYVRYWGEGHGPSSPANIRDLWQRMDLFLSDAGISSVASSQGSPRQ